MCLLIVCKSVATFCGAGNILLMLNAASIILDILNKTRAFYKVYSKKNNQGHVFVTCLEHKP